MDAASASACEIARLPEELLPEAISRTAPRDACRAAAVSPAFRTAADSDAVWSRFLPPDLPPLADGELHPAPPSKKELFMRLSDGPVLLADGLVSMWLDRDSGAKCYMLSARKMKFAWGDTPSYWRWIPVTGSRFSEAARLVHVWWLEMSGKIDSKMLSQNLTYCAYLVFSIARKAYGLAYPEQNASVSLGGNKSVRRVRLDDLDDSDDEDGLETPRNVPLPRERGDGCKEVELGEFYNDEGEDGEVCIGLTETSATVRCGLIVRGIEIRPKKQGGC